MSEEQLQDKIFGLEMDLEELVRAIARRAKGDADADSLYEFTKLNYPEYWRYFMGRKSL